MFVTYYKNLTQNFQWAKMTHWRIRYKIKASKWTLEENKSTSGSWSFWPTTENLTQYSYIQNHGFRHKKAPATFEVTGVFKRIEICGGVVV